MTSKMGNHALIITIFAFASIVNALPDMTELSKDYRAGTTLLSENSTMINGKERCTRSEYLSHFATEALSLSSKIFESNQRAINSIIATPNYHSKPAFTHLTPALGYAVEEHPTPEGFSSCVYEYDAEYRTQAEGLHMDWISYGNSLTADSESIKHLFYNFDEEILCQEVQFNKTYENVPSVIYSSVAHSIPGESSAIFTWVQDVGKEKLKVCYVKDSQAKATVAKKAAKKPTKATSQKQTVTNKKASAEADRTALEKALAKVSQTQEDVIDDQANRYYAARDPPRIVGREDPAHPEYEPVRGYRPQIPGRPQSPIAPVPVRYTPVPHPQVPDSSDSEDDAEPAYEPVQREPLEPQAPRRMLQADESKDKVKEDKVKQDKVKQARASKVSSIEVNLLVFDAKTVAAGSMKDKVSKKKFFTGKVDNKIGSNIRYACQSVSFNDSKYVHVPNVVASITVSAEGNKDQSQLMANSGWIEEKSEHGFTYCFARPPGAKKQFPAEMKYSLSYMAYEEDSFDTPELVEYRKRMNISFVLKHEIYHEDKESYATVLDGVLKRTFGENYDKAIKLVYKDLSGVEPIITYALLHYGTENRDTTVASLHSIFTIFNEVERGSNQFIIDPEKIQDYEDLLPYFCAYGNDSTFATTETHDFSEVDLTVDCNARTDPTPKSEDQPNMTWGLEDVFIGWARACRYDTKTGDCSSSVCQEDKINRLSREYTSNTDFLPLAAACPTKKIDYVCNYYPCQGNSDSEQYLTITSGRSSGLSTGAIVGIVIAVVVVIALVSGAVYLCQRRTKTKFATVAV